MSQEEVSIFENEGSFDENIIDDEVFVGPVTARELEITWRRRIATDRPPKRNNFISPPVTNLEYLQHYTESKEGSAEKEPNLIEDLPPPAITIGSVKENSAPTAIIKPATLVVQSAPVDYKWATKINMKKINKPKRPIYVLSPSKFS